MVAKKGGRAYTEHLTPRCQWPGNKPWEPRKQFSSEVLYTPGSEPGVFFCLTVKTFDFSQTGSAKEGLECFGDFVMFKPCISPSALTGMCWRHVERKIWDLWGMQAESGSPESHGTEPPHTFYCEPILYFGHALLRDVMMLLLWGFHSSLGCKASSFLSQVDLPRILFFLFSVYVCVMKGEMIQAPQQR